MEYEVTIGIPVYNIEKYVRRAIESALAQTFQSIEFLVLDDCGTDNSISIISEIQKTHPRGKDIRIVRQSQNMGLGCARNRIVDEAKGKYLYHLDGDDSIAPNTIELLYDAIKKYDAQIVYGSYKRIEEYGDNKVIICQYPFKTFFEKDEFANYVYRKYNGIQGMTWNFLIDIDIYRYNALRYKAVNFWEDFTFTMDLPTYITRAVLLPDVTYSYYCRNDSLSNCQMRKLIHKEEVQKTINAMSLVKANSGRLHNKPYFSQRMYKVMMTEFYMACEILNDRDIIKPSFSNAEVCHLLESPLSFTDLILFRQKRAANFFLYILSILPPFLSVFVINKVGRMKGLIT